MICLLISGFHKENLIFDFPAKRLGTAQIFKKMKPLARQDESIGVRFLLKLTILVNMWSKTGDFWANFKAQYLENWRWVLLYFLTVSP